MPSRRWNVHPTYKTKYRVKNWAAYDRALVARGDITLWMALVHESPVVDLGELRVTTSCTSRWSSRQLRLADLGVPDLASGIFLRRHVQSAPPAPGVSSSRTKWSECRDAQHSWFMHQRRLKPRAPGQIRHRGIHAPTPQDVQNVVVFSTVRFLGGDRRLPIQRLRDAA